MTIHATLRQLAAPLAVLSLSLGLLGCGDSKTETTPANRIAFNDYESVLGWMPDPKTVTRERAHSGHFSVKVEPGNDYGMGYSRVLSEVLDHKPKKIRIEGWAYMTDANSAARLGFQLFDPATGQSPFSDGIDYATTIKDYGKWVKISKDVVMPTNLTSGHEMRVFLWRAGAATPAYIDDLEISEAQ